MNGKKKIALVPAAALLLFACFAAIAAQLQGSWIARFDSGVIAAVQGLETPGLTSIMKVFTFIGSTQAVLVICLLASFVLYRVLHHRMELLFFAVMILGTACLNTALKLAFHRERPTLHRLIQETGFSFPSGHSMEAFALYATLAFLLWRHLPTWRSRTAVIVISSAMIVLIGVSRIYLGVHYPSDVVAAYCASGFWFALMVWLYQWYMEHVIQRNGRNRRTPARSMRQP